MRPRLWTLWTPSPSVGTRNTPKSLSPGGTTGQTLAPISSTPQEVRRLTDTTNTIEGFNHQLRKATKAKSVFPTNEEETSEQLETNLAVMKAIQKAVLSLEDRNERECLRCRYIDVIEDKEGNCNRLTWWDVALQVYRKDDENAIRATPRLHKRALERINNRKC